MVERIGDWPSDWDIYDVGARERVKEEDLSGPQFGGEAFRAVPPDLDAAILVEKYVSNAQPGDPGEQWRVWAQRESPFFGDEFDAGYKTRWPNPASSEATDQTREEAEEMIEQMVEEYEEAESADDINYL